MRHKPTFIRNLKKLPVEVVGEALQKIELFGDPAHHQQLRVHKLQGKLKGIYSFSVTYSHRIIFSYTDENSVDFLTIGTHDVYN
jgi:mRNA-degrading endonuclease YafQ of YafQ-DinJ toxin-antitoxin module